MYTSDHDIEEEWFEDHNDYVAPDDKENTQQTEVLYSRTFSNFFMC